MARVTFHLIFGLLAMLGVGLTSAGPANAVTGERGLYPASSFYIAAPDRVSARSDVSGKSVCVHVTQRSHEACPACGTSLVMIIVSRVRPKALAPRHKTDHLCFREIAASLTAGSGATRLNAVYGFLSQASATDTLGTNIFARTARLRI